MRSGDAPRVAATCLEEQNIFTGTQRTTTEKGAIVTSAGESRWGPREEFRVKVGSEELHDVGATVHGVVLLLVLVCAVVHAGLVVGRSKHVEVEVQRHPVELARRIQLVHVGA